MAPVTAEEQALIKKEVEDWLDRVTIDKENVRIYLRISLKGKEVVWLPMLCKKCVRPVNVHTQPKCSRRVRIPKQHQMLYISNLTNNQTIKQEASWAIAESGIEVNERNYEKDIDFLKWQKS